MTIILTICLIKYCIRAKYNIHTSKYYLKQVTVKDRLDDYTLYQKIVQLGMGLFNNGWCKTNSNFVFHSKLKILTSVKLLKHQPLPMYEMANM